MADAIEESESEYFQGVYSTDVSLMPNKIRSIGIIATNEKRLKTVEIKFISKLIATYFLYGGRNLFNNPRNLDI